MNCKPGDLAIIMMQLSTTENIGRIVEVVRPAVPGEVFKSLDGCEVEFAPIGSGPFWVIRAPTLLRWRHGARDLGLFEEVPTKDSYLRPVSGLPIDEEERDEVPA